MHQFIVFTLCVIIELHLQIISERMATASLALNYSADKRRGMSGIWTMLNTNKTFILFPFFFHSFFSFCSSFILSPADCTIRLIINCSNNNNSRSSLLAVIQRILCVVRYPLLLNSLTRKGRQAGSQSIDAISHRHCLLELATFRLLWSEVKVAAGILIRW